jgi:lauroyl/myristoyl acyltransferase
MRRADATDLYLLAVLSLFRAVEASGSPQLRERTARQVGDLAYRVSYDKREQTRRNLQTYLGARVTRAQLNQLVRATFISSWTNAFWICRMAAGPEERAASVSGLEHLQSAVERGRGAILLENSFFGQRSAAKRVLAVHGWRGHQTHAQSHLGSFHAAGETDLRTRLIRPAFERREREFVESIIYLPDDSSLAFTRHLARLLGENGLIYISGDGSYGRKHIVYPFHGHLRRFATGVFNLAILTGAVLLPIFCHYDAQGGLECCVEHPLELANHARAAEGAAAQFATQLAKYVSAHPEQYQNWPGVDSIR